MSTKDFEKFLKEEEPQFLPEKTSAPPRLLTNDEIDEILSKIPKVQSPSKLISDLATEDIKLKYRTYLRTIKLVMPGGFKRLEKFIVNKFNIGKIEAGEAVGMRAAEAISQPLSQQTFNSFHLSGNSKNMTMGIEGYTEILEGTRDKKLKYSSIYFHDEESLTIDDIIINKRRQFVGISLNNLIVEQDIKSYETLFYEDSLPQWYQLYKDTVGLNKELPKTNWVLELLLNVDMLYKYKITPQKISNKLQENSDIKCVYSPIMKSNENINITEKSIIRGPVCYIHIYPTNPTELITKILNDSNLSPDRKEFIYLQNILLPTFNNIIIQGMIGISNIRPVSIDIPFSLYLEIDASLYLGDDYTGYSAIKLNKKHIADNAIPYEKIIKFLEVCGFPNHSKIDPDVLPNLKDYDLLIENNGKFVIKTCKQLVNIEKQEENRYRQQQKKLKAIAKDPSKIKIYKEESSILRQSYYLYADMVGTNFYETIKRHDVDYSRSYTNNMYEILAYFGIEAVRTFIIKQLLLLIKTSDSYVDPRHIGIIADYMTCHGIITPLTLIGMKRHNMGLLAEASLRASVDVIKNASIANKSDQLNNMSASIVMGKTIAMGTGVVEVKVDKDKIKNIQKQMLSKEVKKINVNSTVSLISMLENGDYFSKGTNIGTQIQQSVPMATSLGPPSKLLPSIAPVKEEVKSILPSKPKIYSLISTLSDPYNRAIDIVKTQPLLDCEPVDINGLSTKLEQGLVQEKAEESPRTESIRQSSIPVTNVTIFESPTVPLKPPDVNVDEKLTSEFLDDILG